MFDAEGTKKSSPEESCDDTEVEDGTKRGGRTAPQLSDLSVLFGQLEKHAEASVNYGACLLLRSVKMSYIRAYTQASANQVGIRAFMAER